MFATQRPARPCLPAWLALLALTTGTAVVLGRPPRPPAEASFLFNSADIPTPPEQKKSWLPPKTTVPAKFVAAAATLFEQGLADPRGCEYREVRVATGNWWGREAVIVLTHAWVLPGKPEDIYLFAVCWNGLVYPAVSVGARADLKADVGAAIKAAKKEGRSSDEVEPPADAEGRSLWYRAIGGDRAVALLLRVGEGELAVRLWKSNHRPPADEVGDRYLRLAAQWARLLFDRGLCAHMRGDDRLALHDFRLLDAVAGPIEAEAKKRGYGSEKEQEGERFLGFLGHLPELLADQKRRARTGPHPPVVCVGPGRDHDQGRRIASLIDRLDEVGAGQLGRLAIDLSIEPIIMALTREGEPAIEPLLCCFEKDGRLTRSVHSTTYGHDDTVVTVHEVAYAALRALFDKIGFEPPAIDDDLESGDEQACKKWAGKVRERLKTHKTEPLADRLFRTLADDKASPAQWVFAASLLVESDDDSHAHGRTVHGVHRPPGPSEKPRLKGESLRGKKGPSVTELIVKRAGQMEKVDDAASLALALRCWDEKAALPLMAELTPRCREAREWNSYLDLISARRDAGDHKGLDDYVKWVRTLKPGKVDEPFGQLLTFGVMWENPKHPGMAEAADWLFTDKMSPWAPLVQVGRDGDLVCPSDILLGSPLLALPGFRKAVLAELEDQWGDGQVSADRNGKQFISLEGIISSGRLGGCVDPEIPREGIQGTFRVCDFVACTIGEEVDGAPRCELYWTEKRRDAAVAACAAFLKQYGNAIGSRGGVIMPHLARPATREQARKGEAIFSLEGEGEVRTVKLPEYPMAARWVTLKGLPFEERSSDPRTGKVTTTLAYGRVYQAEEVFKEGKWQRFYGFVGSHRVAQVPAAEIEFPPPEERRSAEWVHLCDGLHGRLRVTRPEGDFDEEWVPRWPSGAAPSCALELWNRKGTELLLPDLKGIRPRLYYSRETVSRKGELVPAAVREADWIEVEPKLSVPRKAWAGRVLPLAEMVTAFTFDLRDGFEVNKPGFYRLVLPSDKGEAGAQEVRFSVAPPEKGERRPSRARSGAE